MKLYHGTNIEFGVIDLAKCPPIRDFGQGFYTTSIKHHAERRAQEAVRKFGGAPNVMEFDFDWDEIVQATPTLKIKRFDGVSDEWAHFVMHNRLRKGSDPQHEYDIVEGPVATHQIAFCTTQAINSLLAYNVPPRYKIEELVSELSVALMQDQNISTIEAMNIVYNSDIFAQLADYSNLLYRKPWQEIYNILKNEK